MKINRRHLISGTAASSILFGSYRAFASSQRDLDSYIQGIVYDNFPEMLSKPEEVQEFSSQVMSQKHGLLENKTFIKRELSKWDQDKFQRFIVTQFAISRK